MTGVEPNAWSVAAMPETVDDMSDDVSPRWWSRRGDMRPDWPYMAVFFSAIWLVYLLEPVAAAWDERDTAAGVVGLVSTLLFAVVYLWHFVASRRFAWGSMGAEEASPWPRDPGGSAGMRYLRYALLVALSVVSTVSVGQQGTTTWVFVAVAGLWTFGFAVGIALSAGIAVAYEVLAYHVSSWDRDSGVGLAIALAVLAVGGGMLASRRSRDLSAARRENARLAVEEERNRMARDLHDILGHSLTVITVKAELAGRLVDVDPARARAEIESLETLAREALADVRSAVEGFREISLAGELVRAREALASAGIEARLPRSVDGVLADLRELYAWTVREGVTNVIRHSGARHCTVTITGAGLLVADDGPGGGVAAGQGNGLRGLRERAASVGAVLESGGSADGFELRLHVPDVAGWRPSEGAAAAGATDSAAGAGPPGGAGAAGSPGSSTAPGASNSPGASGAPGAPGSPGRTAPATARS